VSYSANAETIRHWFELSMAAQDEAKDARQAIGDMNKDMEAAGVHSGVISFVRRIAGLKPGRRGYMALLTIRYLEVLRDQVRDPEVPALEETATGPFEERSAA
jgi:hypothetical protein